MTPDEINSMSRDDVLESFEAHGLVFNDDSDLTLADLREKLIELVFIGDGK